MTINSKKFKIFLFIFIAITLMAVLSHGVVMADNPLSSFPGEDLEANDVINIVIGLSCWLIRVAFTLTVIFVIIAGFKFMAAQGNQTKYGEAVKNFQNVLLGILVIYGVYVIIATVAHAVGIVNFSFIPLVC